MWKKIGCLGLLAVGAAWAQDVPRPADRGLWAQDDVQQRLRQSMRGREQAQEREVWEKDTAAQAAAAGGAEHAPQDTGAALYEAVNHGDWPQVRRLLAQYGREDGHDQDVALFARAALARAEGRWKQSKRDYETLLERQPDFTRGRLDLARLLYEGRLNREAAAQFEQVVRTPNLPESVRESAASFQTALKERESWHGSVQAGALWSSNINQSPGGGKEWCVGEEYGRTDTAECGSVLQADPAEQGWGARYEAAAVRHWQLRGHHGISVRGTAYGTAYRNRKMHNSHTANLSAGYRFENHRDSLTLAPVFEWSSNGGKTDRRSYGVRGEWERNGGNLLWNAEWEWSRLDHVERYRHHNGNLFSAHHTLTYLPRHDLMLYTGLDYHRRTAAADVYAYRQASARFGAVKLFPQGFSAGLSTTFRHRRHDGYEAFFQKRRRDREQIYLLRLTAERWQWAGMKPVFSVQHRRVDGNIGLNSYRQNEIGLALQKTF